MKDGKSKYRAQDSIREWYTSHVDFVVQALQRIQFHAHQMCA